MPEISVIISTYNCSNTLRCAIKSVLNQDFKDFEVWIIGDGCTDDSETVVKSFNDARLNWYNLPVNIGSQYAPNNEGLKRAQGKYIAYLGHDDLWFPNHLNKLKHFLEDKNVDFVHGNCILIKQNNNHDIIGAPPFGRTYLNSHIPPSSWMHKKNIVDECGYWADQKKISIGVDREYINRAAKLKKQILHLPDLFVLKFVSSDWSIYADKSNYPQEDFLSEIYNGQEKLLKNVLIDLANSYSTHVDERYTFKLSLARFIENTLYLFYNFYSRDRWPLNKLLTNYFQRVRKNQRKYRGLNK